MRPPPRARPGRQPRGGPPSQWRRSDGGLPPTPPAHPRRARARMRAATRRPWSLGHARLAPPQLGRGDADRRLSCSPPPPPPLHAAASPQRVCPTAHRRPRARGWPRAAAGRPAGRTATAGAGASNSGGLGGVLTHQRSGAGGAARLRARGPGAGATGDNRLAAGGGEGRGGGRSGGRRRPAVGGRRVPPVTTHPANPTRSGGRPARPSRRVVLSGNTHPGR